MRRLTHSGSELIHFPRNFASLFVDRTADFRARLNHLVLHEVFVGFSAADHFDDVAVDE